MSIPTEEEIVFKDRAIMHWKVNALKYLADHLYLANKAVPERGIYQAGNEYGLTVYGNGQIYYTRYTRCGTGYGTGYGAPPTLEQIQESEKFKQWQKEHPRYTEISITVGLMGVVLASAASATNTPVLLIPALSGAVWAIRRLFTAPEIEYIFYGIPLDEIISSATTVNMVKERILILDDIIKEMKRFFMHNAIDHYQEIFKNIPEK
jgi:hypothetical protein